MIQPWAKTFKSWEAEEYAAGYRARLSAIPNSEEANRCWCCGWEDDDTRCSRLLVTDGFLPKTGKTNIQAPGVFCSMLDEALGPTGSHSMKAPIT